jgi:hypothetical protein
MFHGELNFTLSLDATPESIIIHMKDKAKKIKCISSSAVTDYYDKEFLQDCV